MNQHEDNKLTHSPTCARPGVALDRGFSVTVRRCLSCGAVSTERNTPSTTTKEK